MKKNASIKAGMSPGTLVYIGENKDVDVKILIIDYTQHDVKESEVSDINACLPFIQKESVTWINITGIHDSKMIANLGSQFGLHSLVLEDVVNSEQRPKINVRATAVQTYDNATLIQGEKNRNRIPPKGCASFPNQ